MERREFLHLAGAGAAAVVLAGCTGNQAHVSLECDPGRSRNILPDSAKPPRFAAGSLAAAGVPGPCRDPIAAEPRSCWRPRAPVYSRMYAMDRPERVTIHHEGSPHANADTSMAQVSLTLRRIQAEHRRRMNAADIGYHYIIDRAGRVWEGRSAQYQGAHVRGHNQGNLGIMVLGNFEIQRPTSAQIDSLQTLCHMILHGYAIAPDRLFMHRELAATRCPGRLLCDPVAGIRQHLYCA